MHIAFLVIGSVAFVAFCFYTARWILREEVVPGAVDEKVNLDELAAAAQERAKVEADAEALAATQWNTNWSPWMDKKSLDAYMSFQKAAVEADRVATEDALALANSFNHLADAEPYLTHKDFSDPKPVGAWKAKAKSKAKSKAKKKSKKKSKKAKK